MRSVRELAEQATRLVLERLGTGLLDADDDTLEAGIAEAIEQTFSVTGYDSRSCDL